MMDEDSKVADKFGALDCKGTGGEDETEFRDKASKISLFGVKGDKLSFLQIAVQTVT